MIDEQEAQAIVRQSQNQRTDEIVSGTAFWIYGAFRPMSGSWARIPDAVYVNADYSTHKMHTWVIVPRQLDRATIENYELVAQYETVIYQPS